MIPRIFIKRFWSVVFPLAIFIWFGGSAYFAYSYEKAFGEYPYFKHFEILFVVASALFFLILFLLKKLFINAELHEGFKNEAPGDWESIELFKQFINIAVHEWSGNFLDADYGLQCAEKIEALVRDLDKRASPIITLTNWLVVTIKSTSLAAAKGDRFEADQKQQTAMHLLRRLNKAIDIFYDSPSILKKNN